MKIAAMADQTEQTNPYELTRDEIAELIDRTWGCVVSWVRRDGHPAAAFVTHVVVDGQVYITSREGRGKNVALQRDPRTAVVFSIDHFGGATIIGRSEFVHDPNLRTRVFNAMADKAKIEGARREVFIKNLASPGRAVLRIIPEKYISRNERTAGQAYSNPIGLPSNYR